MKPYRTKNRKFPTEFSRVVKYIQQLKGIKVVLGETTEYRGPFTRQIVIHHNYDLKKRGLVALLHECGHAMQSPITTDIKSRQKWDYRYGKFMNELNAWELGMEIANELGMELNLKIWESEKKKSLITYFD